MENLVDLGLALAINYGASMKAAGTPTLRWQMGSGDSPFTDLRFMLGVAGVAAAEYGGNGISRVGEVVGEGMLHSWVAGETYRAQAVKNAAAAASAAPGVPGPTPQIQGGYPPPRGAAYVGGFDYAPAW